MNNRLTPMSVDEIEQFGLLIKSTLSLVNLTNFASKPAIALLLGTAAKESNFKYVYQLGQGPARSYFQIEPATAIDVIINCIKGNKVLRNSLKLFTDLDVTNIEDNKYWRNVIADELIDNLKFAIFICRCCYYRQPFKLTDNETPESLAKYWKKYFNTIKGAGHEYEFVNNFKVYGLTKYLK